jgi:acyl dehydratase
MSATAAGTWQVTQGDLVRYAGAARDFNAIHYDASAARAAGFAGPIAHGMLTLGRLLALLLDARGLAALGGVSCRFTGPAVVGSTLSFEVEETGAEVAAAVADEAGRSVLSASIGPARPASPAVQGLEPVADRVLLVERGPAMRFAEAVGCRAPVLYDPHVAAEAGYAAIPTFPTYAFALPGWGWFADTPGNQPDAPPDAVRDCASWARTSSAVIHAGQRFAFHRPVYVGETVRARSYVTDRSTKTGARSTLHFTEVTTRVTDEHDSTVLTSTMSLVVQAPTTQEER